MTDNTSINELVSEFQQYFPGIQLEGLNTHGALENELCKHVKEFTLEQWQVIVDSKYNSLFQDGIPHVSWNTDRGALCRAIKNELEVYATRAFDETWYKTTRSFIQFGDKSLVAEHQEPIVWGSGSSHDRLYISDEVIKRNTHTAVILVADNYGRIHIVDQMSGQLGDCEDWVAKHIESKQTFKIIEL